MSITILGAGNMAKGLAGLFANSGYEVVLGSRDPSKAQAAFASLGAKVRATDIKTAVAASELVVLAVPFNAVAATIEAAGGLAGKIVVDITNPLTADYQGLTIGHTTSAAEEIQKLAPQAKVVKAFNTLFDATPPTLPPFCRTCANKVLKAFTTFACGASFWISSAALVVWPIVRP